MGTGTAQIPIELCRQSPTAAVVAIDLAEHMLPVGRDNVRRAGLADRIELQRVDAKGLPFADGDLRRGDLQQHRASHPRSRPRSWPRWCASPPPAALLFVRDLLRPADEMTLLRLVATYAGDANAHQRQMFADSLHAALTLEEVRDLVAALGFDPATVRQTTDRHWTWVARKTTIV